MTKVLLVEDTPSLQTVYEAVLRNAGYQVLLSGSAAEGLNIFQKVQPDVVLLDLMLPDRDGLDLMRDMLALRPETNAVVITANGSINRAVEAMRAGAHDFLVKPFDEQRLLAGVRNAETAVSQAATPPAPVPSGPAIELGDFIGLSPGMQIVYERVRSVARSMATVFVSGESGTGKEVCAQAIHGGSPRADGPFVPLNCAAIPSDLLESEVFGHIRGAFTGAIADKTGAAASADGGTLFLDEICEMDLSLQAKLLRFLQTSTIQPLGATKQRKVSVRIICATNRDPLEEVRAGRFREDLYYRLHVVPIFMPPLRERGRDVIDIAEKILKDFASEEGKVFFGLSAEVQEMFQSFAWPGNVRQLLNVVRNVVVLHDGPVVTADMLPDDMRQGMASQKSASGLPASVVLPRQDIPAFQLQRAAVEHADPMEALAGLTLAEIEKRVIEAAISRQNGSVPRAAKELGVSPSTLYRKREAWEKDSVL